MDFWARRRAAVEAEAQDAEARRRAAQAEAHEAATAEKSDADLLEEFGLPEPESLGPDGDFKAFMADGIPQRLKSRALRCLWRSNPVLANVDGLVDYGEDFTDAACVIENMQTAYQVGKGMRAHVEEMARQAEAAAKADTDDAVTPEEDDTELAAVDSHDPDEASDPQSVPEQSDAAPAPRAVRAEPDADDAGLPPRRRMAFTFEDRHA